MIDFRIFRLELVEIIIRHHLVWVGQIAIFIKFHFLIAVPPYIIDI